ncbi:MAG: hypothetical protein M0006_02120 [Magnetospirillum sp.]|nr:hypothetical protein [Magnetospirillum sp.]
MTKSALALLPAVAVLGAAWPALAGPPYLTDDPEPVDYGHWEVYGFATGSVVRGDSAGILPAMEVNYGALPDVQLHVMVPIAYNSQSVTGNQFGYGDTEFGVKYRLVNPGEGDWWPEIGIFPTVVAPTGDAAKALGTGRTHEYLPVWLQKTFGGWITDAGGGYWINPGPGNKNYWFVGGSLQRKVTDSLTLGGEVFHETAFLTGGPGTPGFPLGSRDATGFNIGAVYDFTENYHLLVSAGRGLQNVAATNEFSYYVGYQWTY